MPLIPVYAARRRYLRPDGSILLEDFAFGFRRIGRSRTPSLFPGSVEIVTDPGDVPAARIAAPASARLDLSRRTAPDDLLVLPAPSGCDAAAINLAPRDAIEAARAGEYGLWIFLPTPAAAEGGAP